MTACDFSFARYTAAQLKVAGVTAVGRYLTGPGKAISEVELAGYLFGGIAVWLTFENSATDASGGFGVGQQYANEANAALQAIGLPLSTPVYFAADTDYPNPADAVPYYQGLASRRQALTNGCYGEGALFDLLFSMGLIGYGWESESTSFPGNATASPNAAIWQKVNGAPLPDTDLDVILKADFGQLPRPVAPPAPPSIAKEKEMLAKNTAGTGYWGVRSNANVYTYEGALYHGPHATWAASWGIGTSTNPVVGIAADGKGGYALLTDGADPAQPHIYDIPADDRYKNPKP